MLNSHPLVAPVRASLTTFSRLPPHAIELIREEMKMTTAQFVGFAVAAWQNGCKPNLALSRTGDQPT
jgi:hypothetical protein